VDPNTAARSIKGTGIVTRPGQQDQKCVNCKYMDIESGICSLWSEKKGDEVWVMPEWSCPDFVPRRRAWVFGGPHPHRPRLHKTYRNKFPHLQYEVIDRFTRVYNCIAYSIGVTDRWVWDEVDMNEDGTASFTEFASFYKKHGYEPTTNEHEAIIAVFGFNRLGGRIEVKHAARKEDDWWYSKMGSGSLLKHKEMDVFRESSYGEPLMMFKEGRTQR
jgi:hypothetical protein